MLKLLVPGLLLVVAMQTQPYWKTRAPVPGDPVPPFAFDEVIVDSASPPRGVNAFSAASLKGRVVVLEFFGTWCGPCLALVPHMNDLAAASADLPVAFVTIGNEARDTLERAVKKHNIRNPVVLDADGSTFEDFWVTGLPSVALLDREGRFLGFTHPSALNRQVLERIVNGEPVSLRPMNTAPRPRDWDFRPGAGRPSQTGPPMSASATIEEVDRPGGRMQTNTKTGELTLSGVPVSALLLRGWGISPRDMDVRAELPKDKFYTVQIVPPDGSPDTAKAMLQSLVEKTFKIKVTLEPREREVYLLTRPDGAPPLPAPPPGSEPGSRRGPGLYQMRNATLDDFAKEVSRLTPLPVVNRTGIAGRHSFDLAWDLTDPKAFQKALDALGFKLAKGTAAVDMLVVNPQ